MSPWTPKQFFFATPSHRIVLAALANIMALRFSWVGVACSVRRVMTMHFLDFTDVVDVFGKNEASDGYGLMGISGSFCRAMTCSMLLYTVQ